MSEAVKTRTPKCARCRNHGYTVNLRGHKGFCPHKSCTCELCALVKERQEVSKRQIKLRRQQQQEEIMGMYVPVPPSVFSQGSVCGINLDYLRVLFPRKRVDRLYAVLLQCNNDVNAATVKLQQEENSGETGEALNNLTTKNIPPAPVVKINKAIQWPADGEQDNTDTPTTSEAATQDTRGRRQCLPNNADDSQHSAASHHLFPYCCPHTVPAHFTPTDSVPGLPCDVFGTLPTRPQNKDGVFSTEPFSLGRSVPLEGFPSACNSAPGPQRIVRQTQGLVSKAGLAPISHLPETFPRPQGLAMSVPDMTDLESGCALPSSAQTLNMTPKISHWGSDPIYTSASTTWPEIQATIPMPRMTVPFILPPPPMPPLPPGWDPRSLPPLPFLPTSVPSIFHTAPYSQMPSSLPLSSAHLPHLATFSLAKEATVSPKMSGDSFARPDHLILNTVERSEAKAKVDPKIRQDNLDINVQEVCSDSPEEFIDPTSFD